MQWGCWEACRQHPAVPSPPSSHYQRAPSSQQQRVLGSIQLEGCSLPQAYRRASLCLAAFLLSIYLCVLADCFLLLLLFFICWCKVRGRRRHGQSDSQKQLSTPVWCRAEAQALAPWKTRPWHYTPSTCCTAQIQESGQSRGGRRPPCRCPPTGALHANVLRQRVGKEAQQAAELVIPGRRVKVDASVHEQLADVGQG